MSIKKKLGMGVASAALGLSLIGGGTWAAFNDTATINNQFAAGVLDLDVQKIDNQPINFDLSNMKPGDSIERVFRLDNIGSLAIKEVLLSATADNFVKGTGSNTDMDAFLDQFVVEFIQVSREVNTDPSVGIYSAAPLTLKELVKGNWDFNRIKDTYEATDNTKRINLAPLANLGSPAESKEPWKGLPVDPDDVDDVKIKITFKQDNTRVGGAYSDFVQNKYMGNSVKFFFNLEATQWAGVEVRSNDANGEVNNKVQGSADDTGTVIEQPTNRTTGTPVITDDLDD